MFFYLSVQKPFYSNLIHKNIKIRTYRNIILHVVFYGCEIWSFTLKKERRVKVFENRVLRRIFGPKRDEITGERRKLHNEELYDLYCLQNIVRVIKSRRVRWAGHVARMGERRDEYSGLMGRSKEMRVWNTYGVEGGIILK